MRTDDWKGLPRPGLGSRRRLDRALPFIRPFGAPADAARPIGTYERLALRTVAARLRRGNT